MENYSFHKDQNMKYIKFDDLLNFTQQVCLKAGMEKETSYAVSFGLCETSLRGVDSHGIRLLPHYINSVLLGRKNPKPDYKVHRNYPAFITLDADNTFGHAAGFKAIELGIDAANNFGLSAVSVYNSSHPGAMASFALKAARKGYIAFAFTHADSLVCSFNGKDKYFGTNPICFAAPRKNSEPFCLDMAPTGISWNKLINMKENKIDIPPNLVADKKGMATTEPNEVNSLLPIGGYKGFGLAAMGEVLCGVLSGMNFGQSIPKMFDSSMEKPRKLAQFYIVCRADIAISQDIFESRMAKMSSEVRNLEPKEKNTKVQMPNDPEIMETKKRNKQGIPIDNMLEKKLNQISLKVGLKENLI